jgi:fructoselysine-6-P-deglycase FrlB-like protein
LKTELLADDLALLPETLGKIAQQFQTANPWQASPVFAASRLVLLGMGSSNFANQTMALRLQAIGQEVFSVIASAEALPQVRPGDVVIAVSASGKSPEVIGAASFYKQAGVAPLVALTNTPGSPLSNIADHEVLLGAEVEQSGVATRSYHHTLAFLLALTERAAGNAAKAAKSAHLAAEAAQSILSGSPKWGPGLAARVLGTGHAFVVGAAERFCNAQQGALMVREVPRLAASACETGDWSHIDVYLTKTLDYRMLLFAGSKWQPELFKWCTERGSKVCVVGADLPAAEICVRYTHDDNEMVRLLIESLVPTALVA